MTPPLKDETSTRPTVLVTGATGLIGRSLVRQLEDRQVYTVRRAVRNGAVGLTTQKHTVAVGHISRETDWYPALQGVQVVVHLAALTQAPKRIPPGVWSALREVNVAATLALAAQALAAGVRRFIFLSSVKVLGESSQEGRPLKATDAYAPADAYGVSKMDAELGLRALLSGTTLELVIIRPPVVYGAGMQSNLGTLLRAVERKLPLPFARIDNRRSFVGIDNLVDFIVLCVKHPNAPHQIWMVSDLERLSTPALIRCLAVALEVPAVLWPVPSVGLYALARLARKHSMYQSLCGNLEVDIAPAQQRLSWAPPITLQDGLRRVVSGRGIL